MEIVTVSEIFGIGCFTLGFIAGSSITYMIQRFMTIHNVDWDSLTYKQKRDFLKRYKSHGNKTD